MGGSRMNEAEKLLRMKEKIDKAKTDIERMEGRKDQLYETLKKDFGCKTLKEAEKKLNEMNKELDKKETILADGVTALEEKYEWD
jgi:hypothetical protein